MIPIANRGPADSLFNNESILSPIKKNDPPKKVASMMMSVTPDIIGNIRKVRFWLRR